MIVHISTYINIYNCSFNTLLSSKHHETLYTPFLFLTIYFLRRATPSYCCFVAIMVQQDKIMSESCKSGKERTIISTYFVVSEFWLRCFIVHTFWSNHSLSLPIPSLPCINLLIYSCSVIRNFVLLFLNSICWCFYYFKSKTSWLNAFVMTIRTLLIYVSFFLIH